MNKKLIEIMLDTAINNVIVRKLKEGTLVLKSDSVEVMDNNNSSYFLTYCPYDLEGEELNKVTRRKINNEFINTYTYENIINMFNDIQQEKQQKAIKAESTKYILENLMNDFSILKEYGEIEILANNNTIEYYIRFKRNYNYTLEISLSGDKDIYKVRYNYENSILKIEELKKLIDDIVLAAKEEIQEENKIKEDKIKQKIIKGKMLQIAQDIQDGKTVIIKLKSSYQCLQRNQRYAVGSGKEGKFYNLKGLAAILEYLEKKNVNEYIYIEDTKTSTLTNTDLKNFNYSKIC